MRLEMESKYWKDICFVTLTYNDEHLPIKYVDPHFFYDDKEIQEHPDLNYMYYPTLDDDHLTRFLKRLRKHLDHKIRYYAVGEYGTRKGRPHLHVMFFGLPYTRNTEKLLKECWTYGFVDIRPYYGYGSASYIAGYVQKKLYGKDRYLFKLPEFMRCSQHLGERWLMDHLRKFDDDHPFVDWCGYQYGLPRTFRKILTKLGVLREVNMNACVLKQKEEYRALQKHLSNVNVSESDFFRGRVSHAIEKMKKKNYKRDTTGDI